MANLMIEKFRNLLRSSNTNIDNQDFNFNRPTAEFKNQISSTFDLLFPYAVLFFNKIFNWDQTIGFSIKDW